MPVVPKTEIKILIPHKLPVPPAPVFKKFDKTQPMNSEYNFRTLHENVILLVNHVNIKDSILEEYEKIIDQLQIEKDKLEGKKPVVTEPTESVSSAPPLSPNAITE